MDVSSDESDLWPLLITKLIYQSHDTVFDQPNPILKRMKTLKSNFFFLEIARQSQPLPKAKKQCNQGISCPLKDHICLCCCQDAQPAVSSPACYRTMLSSQHHGNAILLRKHLLSSRWSTACPNLQTHWSLPHTCCKSVTFLSYYYLTNTVLGYTISPGLAVIFCFHSNILTLFSNADSHYDNDENYLGVWNSSHLPGLFNFI